MNPMEKGEIWKEVGYEGAYSRGSHRFRNYLYILNKDVDNLKEMEDRHNAILYRVNKAIMKHRELKQGGSWIM
jgi:hypothetical protein